MAGDIVTRLREGLWRNDCCSSPSCNGDWYTPLDDKDFIEAADEIERLRRMAMTLIDELRQNGGYEAYTPKMLFQEFYEEARRD